MDRGGSSLTCPRCGAALGSDTSRCASCLATLVDPWSAFEWWVRGGIVTLCVLGALWLAGTTVIAWLQGKH